MNWLLYIGGGLLFYTLTRSIFKASNTGAEVVVTLSILSVWIWLMWRFV